MEITYRPGDRVFVDAYQDWGTVIAPPCRMPVSAGDCVTVRLELTGWRVTVGARGLATRGR